MGQRGGVLHVGGHLSEADSHHRGAVGPEGAS